MSNKSNPATRSGKMIPGKGSPPAMWLDGIAAEAITKNQIVYLDSHPVTGTAISSNDKGANVRRKFGVATNATRKKSVGSLYLALTSAASGDTVTVCPIGILNNLDTSGATAGDRVFLSTAGAPTLTSPTTGYVRVIGEVTGVGVSGTGLWNFTGGFQPDRYVLHTGSAAVSAAASVTVTNPQGLSRTGAPAWAIATTVSGVIHVTACTWSTNDLVITLSASYTGNVQWFILD